MTRRESLYLDLLRGLAALAVVFDHAPTLFDLHWVPRLGHQAVMLFFVLSGYVITHVADTRETTARTYLPARFARLWSVLVPALLLTILCDLIGRRFGINPGAYAFVPADWPLLRIGATLVFLAESWVSIQPLSDGVTWSLCAEFWYYMLFAACAFLPPGRTRLAALLVCALLAGFKALLLLPIWLFGVALARSGTLRRLGPVANTLLWAGCLGAALAIMLTRFYDIPIGFMRHAVSPGLNTQLAQARVFWFDWVFGLLVAGHLLGARHAVAHLKLEEIAGPIRWCAGVSFAAYLFHEPLLTLCAAFLPRSQGLLAIALTLAVIALFGPLAERSKRGWRRLLDRAAGVATARTLRHLPQ